MHSWGGGDMPPSKEVVPGANRYSPEGRENADSTEKAPQKPAACLDPRDNSPIACLRKTSLGSEQIDKIDRPWIVTQMKARNRHG